MTVLLPEKLGKRDHHLSAKHPRVPVRTPTAEREERINCIAHIQHCLKEYLNTHDGGGNCSRGFKQGIGGEEENLNMLISLRENLNNVMIAPLYRQWMNLQERTMTGRMSHSK